MSEQAPPPTISTPPNENRWSRSFWITLEFFAFLIWSFSLCKLFIFDIDTYAIQSYLPSYSWILNYRFLFFMGFLVAWLWLIGPKLGTGLLALLILYPVFFLLWRIPSFIFRRKSWVLAFAAFNFTIEFFRSFRRNVTATTILVACIITSIVATGDVLLYLAVAGLLSTILFLYYATFKSAFAPAQIYTLYIRLLPSVSGYITKNNKLDEAIRNLPAASWDATQRKVWVEKVQFPILVNRFYLFLARKFRDYQQSPVPYLHNVGIIAALFLITIVSFGSINLAIYKTDPGQYEITRANFFTFIWYSFNTFVFNFVKEVSPEGAVGKTIWMTEAALALFLIAIVVAMYLSIRSQRISEQVDTVVAALENEGEELESFVKQEYQIGSIDEAVAELDRVKAGLIQIVLWLTKNIR